MTDCPHIHQQDTGRQTFRVNTHNTNGRRLFRGIQLIPEAVPTGAEGAEAVQE